MLESFPVVAVKERQVEDLNLDLFLFKNDISLDWNLSAADALEPLGSELLEERLIVGAQMRRLQHVVFVNYWLEVLHSGDLLVSAGLDDSGVHICGETRQVALDQLGQAEDHVL